MKITSECFGKLFVLAKDNITKQTTNMRNASAQKLKLGETFHVHSLLVLFY